ncbi:hypothetical protein SEA_WEASELS2_13 [Rhodococcus phage Weasels2]|uniref:Uncharacterized protein n=1 Tax=Rhodococcus phage Weasels2 TaxID=1897437 RepID=A0A1I9S9Z7_9CAUD|nr:hypothetical protein FDH04_gp013 [Rhodococcus phage Weasels2]AOZ63603.1 hypothetical protein SEA_WEASELS2_13 [Rhodococcus phage Weasels2]
MVVHNHAPWRGPLFGGACTESTVNGKLIGWCLGSEKTMQHDLRKDVQLSLVLDKEDISELNSILYRAQVWYEQHEKYGATQNHLVAKLQTIVNEALK